MKDKGNIKILIFILMWAVIFTIIFVSIVGCRTVYKPYPVPEIHTEHHYHTDSVNHTDSVIDYQTTIIREVDSTTMAQYGIRLAQAEKAWLIQSDKLYREIEILRTSKRDSIFIHDSIHVPYPVDVIREVEKPLKQWQKGLIWWGVIVTLALILSIYIRVRLGKARKLIS